MTQSVRVYLPVTSSEFRRIVAESALVGPRVGYRVTAALRAEWPDADDEQLEYAVLRAAAEESPQLRKPDDLRRRFVLVAAVPSDLIAPTSEVSQVNLSELRLEWVASAHVDLEDEVDPEDDLAWFAPSELTNLVTLSVT